MERYKGEDSGRTYFLRERGRGLVARTQVFIPKEQQPKRERPRRHGPGGGLQDIERGPRPLIFLGAWGLCVEVKVRLLTC